MSVTEYTGLTLKPGFEKEALAKGGVIAKSVDAILTQTGATVAHYATAVEKPQQLWTFVERESSDRETSATPDFVDQSSPQVKAHLSPSVSSIFNDPANPVVEVLNMSFPADTDASQKAKIESLWEEFVDKALSHPVTFGNRVQGWTKETDVTVPGDETKTGTIFVALISWPSLEKHMEKRDTDDFKNNVPIIRNLPGLIKMNMFHVQCAKSS